MVEVSTIRGQGTPADAVEALPTPGEDLGPGSPYEDAGVDRSLIRESLDRSPAERLDFADDCARELEELRSCVHPRPVRP